MKCLSYFSIRQKLIAIFLIWVIIFISFGVFAIIQMGQVNNLIREIYNRPVMIYNDVVKVKGDIYKAGRMTKDIILITDNVERNKLEKQVEMISEDVNSDFDSIISKSQNIDVINKLSQTKSMFKLLYENWLSIIKLTEEGKVDQAIIISMSQNMDLSDKIDENLENVNRYEELTADRLIARADSIEETQKNVLIGSMIGAIIGSILLFFLIVRSILQPVNTLQKSIKRSLKTGELAELELEGKNEIVEMSSYYNTLSRKLKEMFWLKDNQYALIQQISGDISVKEIAGRAVEFLARVVNAGNGVIYIYNDKQKNLQVYETYAYTQKNMVANTFRLGEGIIGQVGIDKKPILLQNIKNEEEICCGTKPEIPLNIYAFPLIYENALYGVIEFSSFEPFTQLKQEYLLECGKIISVSIHTAMQNDKVKELLKLAEEARGEAIKSAEDLFHANEVLEEQQRILLQQAEELQQSNSELEEQHQILQQQSEELQQTNMQLEEQQQLLEEQARLLDAQNKDIEKSRLQLYKRSRELEIANKYKSEFIANISHELRTPLNSIILLSKIMLRDERNMLNSENLKKIDIINSSGNELLRLIDDILDLSKIESGKVSLNVTTFRSEELARRLRVFFDHIAAEKKLGFIVEDNVNSNITGDLDKISQILRNFLSNAFKFTTHGSVSLRIDYEKNNTNVLAISATDTGIGIEESKQKVIFDEFIQGDGSISRKFGGTGLGLSISKKLCDLMGGYIGVESTSGVGSKFTLYLPKPQMPASHDGIENKGPLGHNYRKEINRADEKNLLIPEKEILAITNRKDLVSVLDKAGKIQGFKVVAARDSHEAITLLNSRNFCGALIELMFSDLSEIKALKDIKSTAELKGISIYILSPNSVEEIINTNRLDRELEKYIYSILYSPSAKNMLIVDNDFEYWKRIKNDLQRENIEISLVGTQREALNELNKKKYNLVISESILEDGSGVNICKYIFEKGLNTFAIIYTDAKMSIEKEREIKRYADSIIVKTAYFNERLFEEIKLFLNKSIKEDKIRCQAIPIPMEESMLSLENKVIMIADDDLRNIFALAAALEKYGAEIIEAENGKIAMEKLKEQKVDLILMDIMMPEMDGYETIQSIRKEEQLKDIPIIVLTAKTLKEDRQKCIDAGANDYISKPVDYELLIRMIKAWI